MTDTNMSSSQIDFSTIKHENIAHDNLMEKLKILNRKSEQILGNIEDQKEKRLAGITHS